MTKLPKLQLDKSAQIEIVFSIAVLTILGFALSKAAFDVSIAGKRSLFQTLPEAQSQALVKENKTGVPLNKFIEAIDLLCKHGRIQESIDLIGVRLKDPNIKSGAGEKVLILRKLAKAYARVMHFAEARAALLEAEKLSQTTPESEDDFFVVIDSMSLYWQWAKFPATKEERVQAEQFLYSTANKLNDLSQKNNGQLSENTKRLIRNEHRLSLIEAGRFLELDNFDPDASSRLP